MKLMNKLLFLSLALGSFQVSAATSNDYKWLKQSEMPKLIKIAKTKHKNRKIANIDNEADMSDMLKVYRDRIVNAKFPKDIDSVLADFESEKKYESFPQDLKFYAARMAPLRKLKGSVYRLIDIAKESNMAHSQLITRMMDIANDIRIVSPSRNVDAYVKYLVEPYYVSDKKVISKFKDVSEFQNYLKTDVMKALNLSARRIQQLDEISKVVWDNRIIKGPNSFKDDFKRYRYIYEIDRQAALVALNVGMANVAAMSAYNIDNIVELLKNQGRLYGFDGFFIGKTDGVSSYDRTKLFYRKIGFKNCKKNNKFRSKYKTLYKLKRDGKEQLALSYKHLYEATRRVRLVWEDLRTRSEDEKAIFNPGRIIPWDNEIESNLSTFEEVLAGQTQVRKMTTGETAKINVPAMFTNPVSDLKKLFPYCFDLGSKTFKTQEGLKYRNYRYGQATEWRYEEISKYLPEVKSQQDFFRSIRVLRNLGGRWSQIMPFGTTVN